MSKIDPAKLEPAELSVALRLKHDLTQEQLAALLEVSIITVYRWENNKARPSRIYLKMMLQIYKDGPGK